MVDAKDRRYKADGMSRYADIVVERNRLVFEIVTSMMMEEWGEGERGVKMNVGIQVREEKRKERESLCERALQVKKDLRQADKDNQWVMFDEIWYDPKKERGLS